MKNNLVANSTPSESKITHQFVSFKSTYNYTGKEKECIS